MFLLKVFLGFFAVLAGIVFSGCESTSSGASATEAATKKMTMREEGRRNPAEIKAVELVDSGAGLINLPTFDLDVAIVVVDTSGSMRSARNNSILEEVVERMGLFLASMPNVSRIELLDASGGSIYSQDASGMKVNGKGSTSLNRMNFERALALYPYESDSNWFGGLRKALAIARREAVGLKCGIFIFGDEYLGNSFSRLEKLVEAGPRVPVSVVRAHFYTTRNSSLLAQLEKFEAFGSQIAQLSGGTYYRFGTSTPLRDGVEIAARLPTVEQSRDALVLGMLALEYPGETWYIEADAESVAVWNKILQREFDAEREFLVAASSDQLSGRAGVLVTLRKEEKGGSRYYVEYHELDESKSREYRAWLRESGGNLEIARWELLWEM